MKKKVLLSSALTIALCLSLIAGSTFALFTSTDSFGIAVNAAKVKMTASVDALQLYSVTPTDSGSITDEFGGTYEYAGPFTNEFTNGGTAKFEGGVLTISKITPGDKVTFNITGANESNVAIQYRYIIECLGGYRLMDGLNVTVNGQSYTSLASYTSAWQMLESGSMTPVAVALELPVNAGNKYQEQSAQIRVVVEAVQGNADVEVGTTPTVEYIAKATDAAGLKDALAAGESEILLGADVTLADTLVVNTPVTIDLDGHTINSSAKKAIELYADATIKGGTIVGANRCVDTRKALNLVLEDMTLIADNYTSAYGNPQPITIGGSEDGTTVLMNNVKVSAKSGYGIIAFVKSDVTVVDSKFSGYNALYVKTGAEDSTFNFINCDIVATTGDNDVEGNSFSAIAIQTDDVTVNVDAASSITAIGNYCCAVSLGWTVDPIVEGNVVNVECPVTGNKLDVDPSCAADNSVNFAQ